MSELIEGRCDYCHETKMVDPETMFCPECREDFCNTVDEYFDGDPTYPLKVALEEWEEHILELAEELTPEQIQQYPQDVQDYIAKLKNSQNL
jgi:hypothetical protein